MKLALVCLLVAQGLTAPSSSEEDMDMRNALSSSEEDDIDMRNALSSSEEDDIDMRNFTLSSSEEEGLDMENFTLSSSEEEEDLDMRAATCKCGIKGGANRIVGGGTLISAEWIVTAAHCLYKDNDFKTLYKPSEQVWTLGEHDFLDWGETKIPTIRSKVEKVIVSPEWNSMTTRGDIALIKLAKPVDLRKYTPACR